MARRTHAARGREVRLVPTWHTGILGEEMAGDVLLPSADAHRAPTSFDAWLEQEAHVTGSGVTPVRVPSSGV